MKSKELNFTTYQLYLNGLYLTSTEILDVVPRLKKILAEKYMVKPEKFEVVERHYSI